MNKIIKGIISKAEKKLSIKEKESDIYEFRQPR